MEVITTKTVMFKIDYPPSKAGKTAWYRRYGLNAYYAGKHWAVRQKDAEYWHTITRAAVKECIKKPVILDNPVVIEAYFNDNMDASNHAAILKMVEDSLKGLLIHDDNRRYVKGVSMFFHNEDYIKVILREVSA